MDAAELPVVHGVRHREVEAGGVRLGPPLILLLALVDAERLDGVVRVGHDRGASAALLLAPDRRAQRAPLADRSGPGAKAMNSTRWPPGERTNARGEPQ